MLKRGLKFGYRVLGESFHHYLKYFERLNCYPSKKGYFTLTQMNWNIIKTLQLNRTLQTHSECTVKSCDVSVNITLLYILFRKLYSFVTNVPAFDIATLDQQ